MGMTLTGVVKWFSPQRGYGFILSETGDEVMVHYNDIPGQTGHRNLEPGDEVVFMQEDTDRGLKVTQVLEFTRRL